jgi:hypothetical protein
MRNEQGREPRHVNWVPHPASHRTCSEPSFIGSRQPGDEGEAQVDDTAASEPLPSPSLVGDAAPAVPAPPPGAARVDW